MHRHGNKPLGRKLSVDDQKALDVVLDHSANAAHSKLTRHAAAVPPRRLTAVSKLLNLLGELPAMDPPSGLNARTMQRIDQDIAAQGGSRAVADTMQAHVH